jgi:hypothetical protein
MSYEEPHNDRNYHEDHFFIKKRDMLKEVHSWAYIPHSIPTFRVSLHVGWEQSNISPRGFIRPIFSVS